MLRRALLALLAALVLALSAPVAAGETTLEARIQVETGIARAVDSTLQSRAAVRAVQIQADLNHCCLAWGEGEILARVSGYEDPTGQMVVGWLGSDSHRAMMYESAYDRIGCATSYLAPRTYGVCLFVDTETRDGGTEPAPAPVLPPVAPIPPRIEPDSPVIPNTAMR